MWLLPLSFFLKRNFSHRVQLGLHYQRKEAAAAAEGASRWKVSLVLFFSPRSRWKFTRNWKMNISDLCARQASLISSWKRWRWLRFLPKNWFLLAFRIHYKRSFFSTVQEDLKSAHNSLGRMERELWAAEDKNGPRRKGANPWQVWSTAILFTIRVYYTTWSQLVRLECPMALGGPADKKHGLIVKTWESKDYLA